MSKDFDYQIGGKKGGRWLTGQNLNAALKNILRSNPNTKLYYYDLNTIGSYGDGGAVVSDNNDLNEDAVVTLLAPALRKNEATGRFNFEELAHYDPQSGIHTNSIADLYNNAVFANIEHPERIIIPVHVGGSAEKGDHWAFVALDKNYNPTVNDDRPHFVMSYLDPNKDGKKENKTRDAIFDGLNQHFNLGTKRDLRDLSCNQQEKSWECGYITIDNIQRLANKQGLLEINDLHPRFPQDDALGKALEVATILNNEFAYQNPNSKEVPNALKQTDKPAADIAQHYKAGADIFSQKNKGKILVNPANNHMGGGGGLEGIFYQRTNPVDGKNNNNSALHQGKLSARASQKALADDKLSVKTGGNIFTPNIPTFFDGADGKQEPDTTQTDILSVAGPDFRNSNLKGKAAAAGKSLEHMYENMLRTIAAQPKYKGGKKIDIVTPMVSGGIFNGKTNGSSGIFSDADIARFNVHGFARAEARLIVEGVLQKGQVSVEFTSPSRQIQQNIQTAIDEIPQVLSTGKNLDHSEQDAKRQRGNNGLAINNAQAGNSADAKQSKQPAKPRDYHSEIAKLDEDVKNLQYKRPFDAASSVFDALYQKGTKDKNGKKNTDEKGIIGRLSNMIEDFNINTNADLLLSLGSILSNVLGMLWDLVEVSALGTTKQKQISNDITKLEAKQKDLALEQSLNFKPRHTKVTQGEAPAQEQSHRERAAKRTPDGEPKRDSKTHSERVTSERNNKRPPEITA